MSKHLVGSLFLTCALVGCGNSSEAKQASAHDGIFYDLTIKGVEGENIGAFKVEIADEGKERAQGLMYRTQLDDDKGMLFIWDEPHRYMMWMKNTNISLDMLFIKDQTILDIALGTVPHSEEKIGGMATVDKVLELPAGRVKALGIQVGHTIHYKAN